MFLNPLATCTAMHRAVFMDIFLRWPLEPQGKLNAVMSLFDQGCPFRCRDLPWDAATPLLDPLQTRTTQEIGSTHTNQSPVQVQVSEGTDENWLILEYTWKKGETFSLYLKWSQMYHEYTWTHNHAWVLHCFLFNSYFHSLCINYVVWMWYLCRIRDIKVLYPLYMPEKLVRHSWKGRRKPKKFVYASRKNHARLREILVIIAH